MKSAQKAKHLSEKKWIPILSFIEQGFYFGLTAVITWFIPIFPKGFKIVGIIFIYFNFAIGYYFREIHRYLTQKLYLEIIPDEMRNSLYSLLPTLGLLFSAPLIIIMANSIDKFGIPFTLLILLILATIASGFEYLSLRYYKPSERVELVHDIYSIGAVNPLEIKIPQHWLINGKIKCYFNDLNQISNNFRREIDLQENSNDDQILIDIMSNLKEYAAIFERSHADGVVDDHEKVELVLLRNDMLNQAEKIAYNGRKLSDKEAQMLDYLKYISVDLQTEEYKWMKPEKMISKQN